MAQQTVSNADRIRPWSQDPRYWQYQGGPVLLVGGSREDNLFQIPDLEEQLDLLASVGGNYIRNTMSDRDEGDVYPFAQLDDGKYDLDQWNDEYWRALRATAAAHGTSATSSCRSRSGTASTSATRANRATGSGIRTARRTTSTTPASRAGWPTRYPDHPSADKQPFYHTHPRHGRVPTRDSTWCARYQERFVAKMLSLQPAIRERALLHGQRDLHRPALGAVLDGVHQGAGEAAAGLDVYVTDMFDDGWKPGAVGQDPAGARPSRPLRLHRHLAGEQPQLRRGSLATGCAGWSSRWRRTRARSLTPRSTPAGETSFGSGTPQDGIERFWRNLLGGLGLVALPPARRRASASTRSRRRCIRVGAQGRGAWCGSGRSSRTWSCSASAGRTRPTSRRSRGTAYVLFFCKGGAVTLDLCGRARDGPALDRREGR